MQIRPEVIPFLVISVFSAALVMLVMHWAGVQRPVAYLVCGLVGLVVVGYFVYFFRDPERQPPSEPDVVLAAADGKVARITPLTAARFSELARDSGLTGERMAALGRLREEPVVRISIFLSLFDVHVNRAPIAGESRFLGYFPGKHFFTFQEKSSDENQHNAILIQNERTICLLNQIVGPVCRRVVYWPDHDRPVALEPGDRIGMMKFGSRLDLYFPAADIDLTVAEGDTVRAGETVIARMKEETRP